MKLYCCRRVLKVLYGGSCIGVALRVLQKAAFRTYITKLPASLLSVLAIQKYCTGLDLQDLICRVRPAEFDRDVVSKTTLEVGAFKVRVKRF